MYCTLYNYMLQYSYYCYWPSLGCSSRDKKVSSYKFVLVITDTYLVIIISMRHLRVG